MVHILQGPPITLPQLIISIPLILILIFGIGFILNMILKTTWLPIYIYLAIVVYIGFQMSAANWTDVSWFIAGLVGAIASGVTIRTLRSRGFRMF